MLDSTDCLCLYLCIWVILHTVIQEHIAAALTTVASVKLITQAHRCYCLLLFWCCCRRRRLHCWCFKFLSLCFSCLVVVIRSLLSFYSHYHHSFIHSFIHLPIIIILTTITGTAEAATTDLELFRCPFSFPPNSGELSRTYHILVLLLLVRKVCLPLVHIRVRTTKKAERSYKRVQQPPTAPVRAGA